MQPGTEVADGVYRLGDEVVSFYVVEEDGRLTVVDAGAPGHLDQLTAFLADRGWSLDDVEAILLTHAHSDHTGFAEEARVQGGAEVAIHEADEVIAAGGDDGRTREGGMLRHLWRPAAYKTLFTLLRVGGISIVPIAVLSTFVDGDVLEVPGAPRVVHVPGHTRGSAALLMADRGAVFTGDALVTWNPGTGRRGAQIMPAAFNESSAEALRSLDRLAGLAVPTVLPGHGRPWLNGVDAAVAAAREAGPS